MSSEQKDLDNLKKPKRIKRILRNWPACLVCGKAVKNISKRFCPKHRAMAGAYTNEKPRLVNITEYYEDGI